MRLAAAIALAVVSMLCAGCGGSGGSHGGTLPAFAVTHRAGTLDESTAPVVAVNVGGPAFAGFSADSYLWTSQTPYSGTGTDTAAMDLTMSNVAPAYVYSSYRTVPVYQSLYYNVTGLKPNSPYHGFLYFEEPLLNGPGLRLLYINAGSRLETQISNLDIWLAAGRAQHKGIAVAISGTTGPDGSFPMNMYSEQNAMILSGFALWAGPAPTPPTPVSDIAINAGGGSAGNFVADEFWDGYSGTGTDASTIDLSAPNAAPAAVYSTYRTSPSTLEYDVNGLAPNTQYHGYLHFEEPIYGGGGLRVMRISVDGAVVIPSFDIFAVAGKQHKAVAVAITGFSDPYGNLEVTLSSIKSAVIVSGLELHENPGVTVSPSPAPSPTPYNPPSPFPSPSPTLGPYLAINAGGAAADGYSADEDWVGYSGTGTDTQAIDLTAPNAAPAYIYSSYRTAPSTLTYKLTGLQPGRAYHGFLHFEEPLLNGPGLRVLNVTANGNTVISSLDIWAAAGGAQHKAVPIAMSATADSNGAITIVITAVNNAAILSGIALYSGSAPASAPNATDVLIDSGGGATGSFQADAFWDGYSGTDVDASSIDVSAAHTAPVAVYESYRTSPRTLEYDVRGLAPNTTYYGYLHFEEPIYLNGGQRTFDISINRNQVATSFDIFSAAGHKAHKAVAYQIQGTSDPYGTFQIVLTSVISAPIISGFELHQSNGPTPTPSQPMPSPSPSTSPTPSPSPSPSPPPQITGVFSQFALPTGQTGLELTAGSDGALWITAYPGDIVRMTTNGATTLYSLWANSLLAGATGITAGSDGALWFMESNNRHLARLTTTDSFSETSVVVPDIGYSAITTGQDGALWFTMAGSSTIGRFTTTGSYTAYPTGLSYPSEPFAIASAPDGTIWFADIGTHTVGHVVNGAAVELTPPASPTLCPDGIAAGPDGNMWFTDCLGRVGKVTPAGVFTIYPIGGNPQSIIEGPDDALWVSGFNGSLAKITVDGHLTLIPLPSEVEPNFLTVGPDGAIWFTERNGSTGLPNASIGRVH